MMYLIGLTCLKWSRHGCMTWCHSEWVLLPVIILIVLGFGLSHWWVDIVDRQLSVSGEWIWWPMYVDVHVDLSDLQLAGEVTKQAIQ